MPAPATNKWGQNGEERAALLRVRTGPKTWRAVRGSFFLKLWERKEKLTCRNTLLAVRKTRGLRNSRGEPAHPHWRKEAGGKEAGREATPSHTANRPRFLS